ncbi:trypsin-like isoform X2 [Daphnia pulex]|uniref:trypsin-like isoform X2 n=1 Tax=Daphnia pulex TaxID=6669 RepID=UPI001EDDFCA2|nr:trypsin-like isoform X2 [Daphnia pulex]
MKFVIVIAFIFIGSALAIYQGDDALLGEFPYTVSLTHFDEHICGGFVYSNYFVLTAASCLIGRSEWDVAVVVAQYSLILQDPEENRIQARTFYINPEYNETYRTNDLALIKLNQPITYGLYVNFSYYDEVNDTYTSAEVMGWGAIMDGGPPSTKLRKAIVSLPADCQSYGIEEFVLNTMICAGIHDLGQDRSSPCEFDQGSPLVQGDYVVGIASKNRGCGGNFAPTIYTRLAAFYPWISNVAGKQPIPSLMDMGDY